MQTTPPRRMCLNILLRRCGLSILYVHMFWYLPVLRHSAADHAIAKSLWIILAYTSAHQHTRSPIGIDATTHPSMTRSVRGAGLSQTGHTHRAFLDARYEDNERMNLVYRVRPSRDTGNHGWSYNSGRILIRSQNTNKRNTHRILSSATLPWVIGAMPQGIGCSPLPPPLPS